MSRTTVQPEQQPESSSRANNHFVPRQIAHFVIYTSRFAESVAWYKAVLGANPTYEDEKLAFLSYDDEHHRVAIAWAPGLKGQPEGTAAIHHVAFTFRNLRELLLTWKRLVAEGIVPYWSVNHGPTTSIYYADPDGNRIEFQVDNFDTKAEAVAYCALPEFAENTSGVDFDPAELLRRLEAGEPEAVLKRRPRSAPTTPT